MCNCTLLIKHIEEMCTNCKQDYLQFILHVDNEGLLKVVRDYQLRKGAQVYKLQKRQDVERMRLIAKI